VSTHLEIIAADIGNSSMTLCRMRGLEVLDTIDAPSQAGVAEIAGAIQNVSRHLPLVIASVNPRGLASLEQAWGKGAYALGRDGDVPIENRTRTPEQAGQDRLCNALAAKQRAGGEAVVIDFGSAITLDVVKEGAYVGGAIAPGIGLAMEALHQKTAMLPLVEIGKSKPPVIGNDTVSAIKSGVYYGYIGLVRNLLAEVLKTFASKPRVIATGGYGAHLAPDIEGVDEVVPELTHEGIALAWVSLHRGFAAH
jgi:type III pantothenate kinase